MEMRVAIDLTGDFRLAFILPRHYFTLPFFNSFWNQGNGPQILNFEFLNLPHQKF